MDGAKLELQEVVDFLKNPDKYTALGAKIPKVSTTPPIRTFLAEFSHLLGIRAPVLHHETSIALPLDSGRGEPQACHLEGAAEQ